MELPDKMKTFDALLTEIAWHRGRAAVYSGDVTIFDGDKGGYVDKIPAAIVNNPTIMRARYGVVRAEKYESRLFLVKPERGGPANITQNSFHLYVAVQGPSGDWNLVGTFYLDKWLKNYAISSEIKPNAQGQGTGYVSYLYCILKLGLILASDTMQYESSKAVWKKLAGDDRVVVFTDMNETGVTRRGDRVDLRQVYIDDGELMVDGADEDDIYIPDAKYNRIGTIDQDEYKETVSQRRLYAVARAGASKVKARDKTKKRTLRKPTR